MRKTITAVAIGAVPSVLFDNLDIQLRGAALDAANTSETWSDRVLGQSRMTGDLPMRMVWSATGNNMAFGSDVGRRVLPNRLQSPLETPEDRTGFKHPGLFSWIDMQRPSLAVAALTILRAYFVAGCPVQPRGDGVHLNRGPLSYAVRSFGPVVLIHCQRDRRRLLAMTRSRYSAS